MGIRELRRGTETVTEYLTELAFRMEAQGAVDWAGELAAVIPMVNRMETIDHVRRMHTAWTNHQIDCPDCTDGQCEHRARLSRLVTEAKRELDRLTAPGPKPQA